MLPVFPDYAKFLKEKTGLELEPSIYWYDRSIIKGFREDGTLCKLYRLKINDDLSMSYSVPKGYQIVDREHLLSHEGLLDRNRSVVRAKEEQALSVIEEALRKHPDSIPIAPVSTGKDSMCVLSMLRKVYPDARAVFNNTSLDVFDTYQMVKKIDNCEIMNPERGFYQYVRSEHMIPTRFSRFCCRIFKSGVMVQQLDHDAPYLLFLGMRNDESPTRKGYTTEYYNPEWGKTAWQGLLPIREWDDLDVWLYTFEHQLMINPKYKKGYARVGCGIACPFYNKNTWVLDEYWYSRLRARWLSILKEDFLENKKMTILNCTLEEYLQSGWHAGVFRDEPTPEVIQEFRDLTGLWEEETIQKYFNHYCIRCGKRLKKDDVGLSLKFHGRESENLLCKSCFSKEHDMPMDKIDWFIACFKRDGCGLF